MGLLSLPLARRWRQGFLLAARGTAVWPIGADSRLTPGTFFVGRIDDVRIYNRTVTP
jgi:hypothetical protein